MLGISERERWGRMGRRSERERVVWGNKGKGREAAVGMGKE